MPRHSEASVDSRARRWSAADRSDGERELLRLLRANEIHNFKANAHCNGCEVDFLWPELSFCIELDGWDAHSSRSAFERDRVKWADLDANGIDVMCVTGRQLAQDKRGVIARLLPALRRRGYAG